MKKKRGAEEEQISKGANSTHRTCRAVHHKLRKNRQPKQTSYITKSGFFFHAFDKKRKYARSGGGGFEREVSK